MGWRRSSLQSVYGLVLLLGGLSGALGAPDEAAQAVVANLEAYRFDRLGHAQIQSDSIRPVYAPADRPHKMLIVPVRFSDIGYDRYAGDPQQDDRNRAWFQQLLFAGGATQPAVDTLSHYYRHQSRGRYNVTGDIFPVVQLERPLHYYGRPVQGGDGEWRSDENSDDVVADALRAAYRAHPEFPWHEYDQWDPHDFDGDGNRDEPDGYIDHFVLVVAGKGQSDCQLLYNLDEKLSVQSPPDAFDDLTAAEQACADRLWPHRSALQLNLDDGPAVAGRKHVRGGIPVGNGLWLLDYNMQSEYTDVSTFIHEFGHSLGLPDIYARETNNSTGFWDAMSSTEDPVPQEMSAWSRMMLGWLQPCVIKPVAFGGAARGSIPLKVMNDWGGGAGAGEGGACDAAMVILPPKYRDLDLGPLGEQQGSQAAYSGQGNDMLRSLGRRFDFSAVAEDQPLQLSLDLWFRIETEWDYLYVEAARDGEPYRRLLPVDKQDVDDRNSVMPFSKGHEGKGTLPGFTGLSGDLDGDNRVDNAPGCDPTQARRLVEDSIGDNAADPCQAAQWVTATFDLEPYRGGAVNFRITYYTDAAAVEDGALVDNIVVPALGYREDFEAASLDSGWDNTGFSLSPGSHHLAVPQFYLLEYRDPYAEFAAARNYDAVLAQTDFRFFLDPDQGLRAASINYRPGVVMWYYNGEYLWGQNDPAELGPGNGYLLVVDSTPQEFHVPLLPEKYYREKDGWTWWDLDDSAQPLLETAFVEVMCFERRADYYPSELPLARRQACQPSLERGLPPVEQLHWQGRQLTYGYTITNEYLPGPEQAAREPAGTMYDLRIRNGETQYRLFDRILRRFHSADAPFALAAFPRGLEIYQPRDGGMALQEARPFAPVSSFSDSDPGRYLNPNLPFGSAALPRAGFSFDLAAPGEKAPAGSVVRVDYRWR